MSKRPTKEEIDAIRPRKGDTVRITSFGRRGEIVVLTKDARHETEAPSYVTGNNIWWLSFNGFSGYCDCEIVKRAELPTSAAELTALQLRYTQLGPTARRVLLAVADRLVLGLQHGDFENYTVERAQREASEELTDRVVYRELERLLSVTKPPAPECDTEGFAPSGKPWVPERGRGVRIVYIDKSCNVCVRDQHLLGTLCTVADAWPASGSDFRDVIILRAAEKNGATYLHCRVVPA